MDFLDEPWETDLADVLRDSLSSEYADAPDEAMDDALDAVLDTMSPAEAFNFSSALGQIGKGLGNALADPTVAAITRTALPIAAGALGTVIGGPVGMTLGTQLGTFAAGALPPARGVAPPAGPPPAAPPPAAPQPVAAPLTGAPGLAASPVAGGSAAAAQGLVLSQHPQVLQSLLSTALGAAGRREVGGVPVAQMLGLLSQVFGQAAADADELHYLGGGEDLTEVVAGAPDRALYTGLIDADNWQLAEALDEWTEL